MSFACHVLVLCDRESPVSKYCCERKWQVMCVLLGYCVLSHGLSCLWMESTTVTQVD